MSGENVASFFSENAESIINKGEPTRGRAAIVERPMEDSTQMSMSARSRKESNVIHLPHSNRIQLDFGDLAHPSAAGAKRCVNINKFGV